MPALSRRRFLASSAAAAGAAVGALGPHRAAAATPRDDAPATPYGDLRDIKHVVILMQENRSFDHYFGTLKGVRGFGDRSTITLPGGGSVFDQPTGPPGSDDAFSQYPWHLSESPPTSYPEAHQPPSARDGALGYLGTPHSWDDQHGAWAGGWMNGWVAAKRRVTTLGYLNRSDIPFQYALADAYTVGDAYHCSVMSSTGPNRTFMFSGMIDAAKNFSHFTPYSGGDERHRRLKWTTFAESLQSVGVTWKVYQCRDHFSDNALEYFQNFAVYDSTQKGVPVPGTPLYDRGIAPVPETLSGISANADNLAAAIRHDSLNGTLPQVSWVVTNKAFSEHPEATPNDGAYFVKGILDALNANPDVFNSTLVILTYDENDGQFDHVPPPVPPRHTPDEWLHARLEGGYLDTYGPTGRVPVGLGFRVPLVLISPWTRGGWVTSEVADHTSIIQLIEKWTAAIGLPATCPNISEWRRGVCGDLTRAFDFAHPVYGMPDLPSSTVTGPPSGGAYTPAPASNQLPAQEPGTRRARPLPYQPNANLDHVSRREDGSLGAHLVLSNNGPHVAKFCHFAVYNNAAQDPSFREYPTNAPVQFTIRPTHAKRSVRLEERIRLEPPEIEGNYDLTVIGPNRFLRHFTGDLSSDHTSHVEVDYYPDGLDHFPVLAMTFINGSARPVTFTLRRNHYADAGDTSRIRVPAKRRVTRTLRPLAKGKGWYDVTVRVNTDHFWSRRYVGHLETGKPSITGS